MSVQTTADDRLEDAANHIHAAAEALDDIVIRECYGHDEYREETQEQIQDVFWTLVRLRGTPALARYRGRTGRTVSANESRGWEE